MIFCFLGILAATVFGLNYNGLGQEAKPHSQYSKRAIHEGTLSPEKSIVFELHCGTLDRLNCTQAELALKRVGSLIGNEIRFKVPFNVNISFTTYEAEKKNRTWPRYTSESRIVVAQSIVDKNLGQKLSYPEALIKQTDTNYETNQPDLTIRFNSLPEWNFLHDAEVPLGVYDFELVIAQQITESLGFHSELREKFYYVKSKLWSNTFRAKSVITTKHNRVNDKFYMNHITPFDALMHSIPFEKLQRCLSMINCAAGKSIKSEALAPIAQKLEKYQLKLYNQTDRYPFIDDQEYMTTAKKLKSLCNTGLVAKLSDNSILKLDGKYLGNAHQSLFDTEEFLMTGRATIDGCGLGSLMKKHGMDSIYGPNTLKVLEDIGWATKRESQFKELRLAPTIPVFMTKIKTDPF